MHYICKIKNSDVDLEVMGSFKYLPNKLQVMGRKL